MCGHPGGLEAIAEATAEGVLIRPAVAVPVEVYSPERKGRLLLENAVDAEDYALAAEEVRRMGLQPDDLGVDPPEDYESGMRIKRYRGE